MINLCPREDCTGCMACRQKCGFGAIHTEVVDGFDYPVIDAGKCTECGNCVKACPVLNKSQSAGVTHHSGEPCVAAWNKDIAVRKQSSSGGVFSAFANKVISDGGVVFGATFDDGLKLHHAGIDSLSQLDSLRRSKYVQSDPLDTFNEVRRHLQDGRKVLYCGTPCQIAGLRSFLGKTEASSLLCVDVLCQGVPSPYLFKQYIDEVESDTGIKVEDCNFRSKKYGWRCGLLLLLLSGHKDGRKRELTRILDKNVFYNSFIKEYFMRPSCYRCIFKNDHQGYYGDITLADFWRIGSNIPLKVSNYEMGISAVVVNTNKGREFLAECSSQLEMIDRTWDEFATNDGLRRSHKPSGNDEALKYLEHHSWEETQNRFFPLTRRKKAVTLLKLLLGERNLMKLKKFLRRK